MPRSAGYPRSVLDPEARIAELGLLRPAPFETDDDDPRAFLWWLLRMATHTRARRASPLAAVDPHLLQRLEALVARRPTEDPAHAQLAVDAASTLRRALLARDRAGSGAGPILAVGDDDGVSLALALLGAEAAAVDVDGRVLEWLVEGARSIGSEVDVAQVDVFDEAVPDRFTRRCAAVVTDPARSFEDCEAFLGFGAACLRTEAPLIWADHPDWNFEHDAVMESLARWSLRCDEVIELVHAYPLASTWLPDPASKAAELGVDEGFLAELFAHTNAWTNAYVLRRMG